MRSEAMFHRISLRLAPSPSHKAGGDDDGFEIVAPLDGEGRLDATDLAGREHLCRVERFVPGEPRRYGCLVHRAARGRRRAAWAFAPDIGGELDVGGLANARFAMGAVVALRDRRGATRRYKVARLEPVALHEFGFRDQPWSDY